MGLVSPMPLHDPEDMPALELPEYGDWHHLYRTDQGRPRPSLCGSRNPMSCDEPWREGMERCPRCGGPVCPTCLDMARAWKRGGIVP